MTGRRKLAKAVIAAPFWIDPTPSFVDPVIAFANDDLDAAAVHRWSAFLFAHPNAAFDKWRRVEHLVEDQTRLRSLLGGMVSGRSKARLNSEVAKSVGRLSLEGSGGFRDAGRFSGLISFTFGSTEQWYAIALAALIHSGGSERVGRCPDVNCRKYFVDWPHPGTRMKYCSKLHQDRNRPSRSKSKQEAAL